MRHSLPTPLNHSAAFVLLLIAAMTTGLMICGQVSAATSTVRDSAFREQSVEIQNADVNLTGVMFVPVRAQSLSERRPAILLMHGCGGMVDRRGELAARHRDWAERFARWGFVALTLDSFSARGIQSICELKDRPIQAWKERTSDAYAALRHLVARGDVDPGAVFVLGWSHGGSTVLSVVRSQAPGRVENGPQFKAAVAFYPGCATPLRQKNYRPNMPLLILHGADDDWTPAAPCIELEQKMKTLGLPVRTVVYAGAVHGFDQPVGGVRLRADVYNPAVLGERGAQVGKHPKARLEAIDEVRGFVELWLRR